MRQMTIVPDGWPRILAECRPGYFVYEDDLFLMSEYGGESYCSSGERCCLQKQVQVQPVIVKWIEVDSEQS